MCPTEMNRTKTERPRGMLVIRLYHEKKYFHSPWRRNWTFFLSKVETLVWEVKMCRWQQRHEVLVLFSMFLKEFQASGVSGTLTWCGATGHIQQQHQGLSPAHESQSNSPSFTLFLVSSTSLAAKCSALILLLFYRFLCEALVLRDSNQWAERQCEAADSAHHTHI